MRKNCFYMLTFQTTHNAIRTEKALKPHLHVIVMPVLRQGLAQIAGVGLGSGLYDPLSCGGDGRSGDLAVRCKNRDALH